MKLEFVIGGIVAVALIGGALVYAGREMMDVSFPIDVSNRQLTAEEKEARYEKAPELAEPDGYINTDGQAVSIGQYRGDKVVLLDIWTYSCINCQRTIPYLKAWHEKYADDGLVIIGVHTPEFAFEKVKANVEKAVRDFGIEYPVVQDNEYKTWRAYGNQYWPRKYLIDIDGYIVYDHIGEGAYAETERQIRKALSERATRLGTAMPDSGIVAEEMGQDGPTSVRSPETYFGAWRNENLGNGTPGLEGRQVFSIPVRLLPNVLYLDGTWDIEREYAKNASRGARIHFSYTSSDVYFVARADTPVMIRITRDGGERLGDARGADVGADGIMTVHEDRLYKLVEDSTSGEHIIEMEVLMPGLEAYTFTFG